MQLPNILGTKSILVGVKWEFDKKLSLLMYRNHVQYINIVDSY